jgi:hypothetical protein
MTVLSLRELVPSLAFVLKLLLALPIVISLPLIFTLGSIQYQAWRSPLNILRGPREWSWLLGSFIGVSEPESHRVLEVWLAKFGKTIRTSTILGVRILPLYFLFILYCTAKADRSC